MVKWREAIKITYYEAVWDFDSPEEAATFAMVAAKGRNEKGTPVPVTIYGVLPEEEEKDE